MSQRSLRARLNLMMFLEYAVRGMWFPFLATYLTAPQAQAGLGFTSGQVGWILGFANAVGAVTAPWIAGQVADRYFNAERALAVFHVLAAIALFSSALTTQFSQFFVLMLLFSIVYVPTQSLTNSLALTHLEDREHTYPRTRLFGTIGWVVASAAFTYFVMNTGDKATDISRIPWSLKVAAVLGVAYAGYAWFVLPATPPQGTRPASGAAKWAALGAFRLLRDPSILALTVISLPVAAISTAYYLNIAPYLTEVVGVPPRLLGPAIGISQTSEVVLLFTLGKLLRRWGYKKVLLLGAVAQAARFAIFAISPGPAVVLASLALHGIAYACFTTTAILYIERSSPPDIRHSAQTVFGIVLFGLGPALAGPYSEFFDRFTVGGHPDFRTIWWTQFWIAVVCLVAVVVFFHKRPAREEPSLAEAEAAETGVE